MYFQPNGSKILWKKKSQKKRKREEIQDIDKLKDKKDYIEIQESNSDNPSDQTSSYSQRKKRGPKTGFINEKVNNALRKILRESDIPFGIQNEEIVINYQKKNDKTNTEDKVVKEFSFLYQKYFKSYENNNKDIFGNSFEIVLKDNSEIKNNSTMFENVPFDNLNMTKQLFKDFELNELNSFNIDYNLISDFFKYCFTVSLIINPSVMLMRIKRKLITPALLFAIYSGAYLYRPKRNLEKAKYYSHLSKIYLLNNFQTTTIQNIQTAYILSNLEPGTKDSYLLSGMCRRLFHSLNIYNCSSIRNNLLNRENIDTFWNCLNNELLLNLTCNCIPDQLNWLNPVIPKYLTDPFLFENDRPSNIGIKYYAISGLLVKVLKHVKNRNNGKFNNEEFNNLKEEIENVQKLLKYDYDFINKSKYKNEMKFQFYTYILFFTTKLILYNIKFSPYVYGKRLNFSKKYIQIRKKQNIIESNFEISNNKSKKKSINNANPLNNETYRGEIPFQPSEIDFLNEKINDFEKKYQTFSLLERIPYPGFNYKLYNKTEKTNKNENIKFLKLHPSIKNIDYEKLYNICFDIVEEAKHFLKNLNKQLDHKIRIYYPWYLGFSFYNIGLFYMVVYANFKVEKVKNDIEYFHEQIKEINNYFPYLSFYYSKMYQNAKLEAYEAYSNNSILFCPKELY
ncbi:hypothetical protein PIROE2DRAFT_15385 [Piromyces sp. E2]|nr:hypothetical protein PIROE2DRAFT_15385 [Piromyces sp. E2]|eukprot:OUM59159.1 hypothetical protein PIROE2DRAFT_15385 [Piromyces sp. E2]